MARNRPACKECWEPVDRDGAEICDWCAMTPLEREADMTRRWLILGAVCVVLVLFACLVPPQ